LSIEGERAPLAVAYGGEGMFGIAYVLGVAEVLVDGGVPLATAPAVGTSAGAWAAAGVALDVRWSNAIDVLKDRIPRMPDPRPGRLRAVAATLFGESRAPTLRVVVCRLPSLRRRVLSAADHPVAKLIAASAAVPGLLAPERIGACPYVDGGVRSLTSSDLAAPGDHLLVVAPMAGPMFGPSGSMVESMLRREMRTWHRANPNAEVWLIRPNQPSRAWLDGPTSCSIPTEHVAAMTSPTSRAKEFSIGGRHARHDRH
jgi:NTE family protein